MGAMVLPRFVGEHVGTGAVFFRQYSPLGRDRLGRSDSFTRRHDRNVVHPLQSVKQGLPLKSKIG